MDDWLDVMVMTSGSSVEVVCSSTSVTHRSYISYNLSRASLCLVFNLSTEAYFAAEMQKVEEEEVQNKLIMEEQIESFQSQWEDVEDVTNHIMGTSDGHLDRTVPERIPCPLCHVGYLSRMDEWGAGTFHCHRRGVGATICKLANKVLFGEVPLL